MHRCGVCGADTILCVNGTPICPKCDREREDAKRIEADGSEPNGDGGSLERNDPLKISSTPLKVIRFLPGDAFLTPRGKRRGTRSEVLIRMDVGLAPVQTMSDNQPSSAAPSVRACSRNEQ